MGAKVIATESNVTENTRSLTVRAAVIGKDEVLLPGAFAKVKLSFDPDPNAILGTYTGDITTGKREKSDFI